MPKLEERDIVCAEVLHGRGRSIRSISRDLGVDESTLRYRLWRRRVGVEDGRGRQPEVCGPYSGVITGWLDEQKGKRDLGRRQDPIKALYEELVVDHGYAGSYKSVVRYVRRRTSPPKLRPRRRVETMPGAQAQVDWLERWVHVEDLGGPVRLSAFIMVLSHSRMWSVVWSRREDFLSWVSCHNHAFTLLGGVPYSLRIDNLKTGVASGAGPWARLNDGYDSYATQVGFIVDPHRPGTPADKGKVERRGRDVKWVQIKSGDCFQGLSDLQSVTEGRIMEHARKLLCPVTGQSVYDSWQEEKVLLKPLPPTLPRPFDIQVSRLVSDDCLVSFEGRQYQVPFRFMRRLVEVRGCPGLVEIHGEGLLLATYPRQTECRLLLDQRFYEGAGDDRVSRPVPLGEAWQEDSS